MQKVKKTAILGTGAMGAYFGVRAVSRIKLT